MPDTTEQEQEEEREGLLVPNRMKDPQAQPQDPQSEQKAQTDPDQPTVAPRGTVAGGVAGEPEQKDPQTDAILDISPDQPTVAPRGTAAGGVAGEPEQKDPHTDPDNPTVAPAGGVAHDLAFHICQFMEPPAPDVDEDFLEREVQRRKKKKGAETSLVNMAVFFGSILIATLTQAETFDVVESFGYCNEKIYWALYNLHWSVVMVCGISALQCAVYIWMVVWEASKKLNSRKSRLQRIKDFDEVWNEKSASCWDTLRGRTPRRTSRQMFLYSIPFFIFNLAFMPKSFCNFMALRWFYICFCAITSASLFRFIYNKLGFQGTCCDEFYARIPRPGCCNA